MFKYYYDESEHSRKINLTTVESENYYDNFITAIIGWSESYECEIEKKYLAFEEKYSARKSNGELKSTTIKQKQLVYGFASLNKGNIQFINDFFELFNNDIHLYFSVISKIEYLILQIFRDYKNSLFIDMDAMKYSITKAILVYRPKKVMDCIYSNPQNLINELILFFKEKIEINKANIGLKIHENKQFAQIVLLLKDVQEIITIDWNYDMGFEGFKKYLDEKCIHDYTLNLDAEGEQHSTLLSAERVGLINVKEINSTLSFGVRMSDIMAGIISKFLKQLFNSLHCNSFNNILEKKLLDKRWFDLNKEQFDLYKKLHTIIMEYDHYWYKAYSGIYSDDLVSFTSLLQYFNNFNDFIDFKNSDSAMNPEHYNTHTCVSLSDYYDKLSNKIRIEPIPNDGKEFYLNNQGARVYYDSNKQPNLKFITNKCKVVVLSVGLNNYGTPIATIKENNKNICYRLPKDLSDWAVSVVAYANMGENLFPCEVIFTKHNNHYYADLL